ncbi:MAG: radical SAM protein [archaeon]|nr:radical SAM protein [archaeon]
MGKNIKKIIMTYKYESSILLISPSIAVPGVIPSGKLLPLATLYLSAVLDKYLETKVLDLNLYKTCNTSKVANEKRLESVKKELAHLSPAYVGINCLFSAQINNVIEIAFIVKQFSPEIKVVLGGMHPTLFGEAILKYSSDIDYVVLGEGEETIVDLIDAFENERSVFKIDGLSYRDKEGRIHTNPKTKFIQNLDTIPMPAYHLFDMENYRVKDFSNWHNPLNIDLSLTIPIMSSRACPLKCNFCTVFQIMGKKYRMRSAKSVFGEMKLLYEKYGVRQFDILDDNFTVSKKRTLEICKLLISNKMKIQLRFITGMMVNSLDDEVIAILVEAGLTRALIAIESGSEYMRNRIIGKHLDNSKIFEVCETFSKYSSQVLVTGQFIIGLPEETNETFEETYNFLKKLYVDDFTASIATPYPGTKLYEQCLRDNLLNFIPGKTFLQEGLYVKGAERFSDDIETIYPIFIKPYAMECYEVEKWAHKFDELRLLKCAKFLKKYR